MDQTNDYLVRTALDLFRGHLYAFLETILSSAYGRNWVGHARIMACLQPQEQSNGMDLPNMLKVFEKQYDVIKFDLPPTFPRNLLTDLWDYHRKVKHQIALSAKESYEGVEIVARFLQYIQASNSTIQQFREILRERMNKEIS